MPLLVKICGLKTPDALDAALEAGADMVGFVFFPPSPRNLGVEAARALGRAGEGPGEKGRAVGRRHRCRARPRGRGAQARHAATARQGDAGARRRGALALPPAGDEGAADRDRSRSRADPPLREGRRLAAVRRPRAARGDAARRARQDRSTGPCWKISISKFRSCCRAGSMRPTSPRRCGSPARRRSMCRRGSSARRAKRTRTRFARSSAPRALRRQRAWPHKLASTRMTVVAAAQFVPHRARRARALRHLRRPLRRRDADAADPGA